METSSPPSEWGASESHHQLGGSDALSGRAAALANHGLKRAQETSTAATTADKRSRPSHPVIVEKIVPQHHYVEKIVEVPVIKYVNVPREVIQYVPKVEVKVVEQEVPVPGPIVEVAKPVIREIEKVVYDYQDKEVQTTVACTLEPHIEESKEQKKVVRVKKYVPYMVPVEVFIPVPVNRDLVLTKAVERTRVVTMPPSQYNAQVKAANPTLQEQHLASLYQQYEDGSVPMFKGPGTELVPPKITPSA